MGRSAGREETDLPVFDADAALSDRPAGGGAPNPGRRPHRARGIGVAVAAIALLTAGIAVGGALETPNQSGSPAASGSPDATSATCFPVPTDRVPAFLLAVAEDPEPGTAGQVGYTRRPGDETPGISWVVPAAPAFAAVVARTGNVLEVRAAPGACVRYVQSEYADAALDRVPGPSERRPLFTGRIVSPTPTPTLGSLPDGDWVVRVMAYFETGLAGPDGLVISEAFFRVRVGNGPFATPRTSPGPTPEPTPAVTPALPCGPSPAPAAAMDLLLAAPGVEGVAGAPAGTTPPQVSVGPGESASLTVPGAACATSWDIRLLRDGSTEPESLDVLNNPGEDPGHAAQNRWIIMVPVGDFRLVASLKFGADSTVVREWRLQGRPFVVPKTVLTGPDGTEVEARAGCGLSISLANGYSASDSCGSIGFPDGLAVLRVPAWSRVVLEVSGWTIAAWNGSCGRVVADAFNPELFEQLNGCSLGGYRVADNEAPPSPAQFLARPGEQVLALYVRATRGGDAFDATMYALVTGE